MVLFYYNNIMLRTLKLLGGFYIFEEFYGHIDLQFLEMFFISFL